MCHSNQQHNSQGGSVILAILSMATLSSIAMVTMMFTLRSMNKNLTLHELQNSAQQVLSIQNNKTISDFLLHRIPHTSSRILTVLEDEVEYRYRQYPDTIRNINWPLPGFSISSNYASKLIRFKSQIKMDIIQTPVLVTGLYCIDVISDTLNNIPKGQYSLSPDDQLIDSIQYELIPQTGEIRKTTAAGSNLIIGLTMEPGQSFSRADFAVTKVTAEKSLAIIFAVTNPDKTTRTLPNKLYVLFDDLRSTHHTTRPLFADELINLTSDYLPTGHESGYALSLGSGQLEVSAITTINDQVVFLTQQLQFNSQTHKQIYKNELYTINLDPAEKQILQTRTLADSTQLLKLKIQTGYQNRIIISTQTDPKLLDFPLNCTQIFQYEK